MNCCASHVQMYRELMGASLPVGMRVLLDFGKVMEPARDTEEVLGELGETGYCYMNAYRRMDLDFNYAEGFAMKPGLIPLPHAWLTDGVRAYDVTWPDGESYFGVQFSTDFVYDMALRIGYYGILDQLYMLRMDPDECYEYLASGVIKP